MLLFNFRKQSFELLALRIYAFVKHLFMLKFTLAIYLTLKLKAFSRYELEQHIYD